MGYTAGSFTAGEIPTTSKWNQLWNNDASFNDSSGINLQINNLVGYSNPYKFRAYRNAAASTGNGAFAVVAFDTEQYDTNNNLASGVYTAPIAGFYLFTASLNVSSGGADATVALFKNGTETSRGSQAQSTTAGLVVSDIISLAATDTVDVRAYASSTKALNVGSASQNYFAGILVCRT